MGDQIRYAMHARDNRPLAKLGFCPPLMPRVSIRTPGSLRVYPNDSLLLRLMEKDTFSEERLRDLGGDPRKRDSPPGSPGSESRWPPDPAALGWAETPTVDVGVCFASLRSDGHRSHTPTTQRLPAREPWRTGGRWRAMAAAETTRPMRSTVRVRSRAAHVTFGSSPGESVLM